MAGKIKYDEPLIDYFEILLNGGYSQAEIAVKFTQLTGEPHSVQMIRELSRRLGLVKPTGRPHLSGEAIEYREGKRSKCLKRNRS